MTFRHDTPGRPAAEWEREVTGRPLTALDLGDLRRVVLVAAHPDDETLGAAGLAARAHDEGLEVRVVVATSGEASHPRSPTHTRDELAAVRRRELAAAVDLLVPGATAELLGLPDGRVADHESDLTARLVDVIGDGRDCLVVAPWRHDGHPDHDAAGRAAATAAVRTGARLLEYPVWFWHWGEPDGAPWPDAVRLDLTEQQVARKAAAVRAHRSQVAPLSSEPGDEVLLSPALLAHFEHPYELFWRQPVDGDEDDGALETLHAADPDPWGVDYRFYEQRKRALLLSMLPRERFRSAVEVGCSTGALAADLAARCDTLVALDRSATAVRRAVRRLEGHPHADVRRSVLPQQWPDGTFDLVVVSEVGYFLSPADLDGLVAAITSSLTADGVVVACHWRHDVVGWPLDGPAVHEALRRSSLPPVVAEYHDRDVEILVCCRSGELPDPRA